MWIETKKAYDNTFDWKTIQRRIWLKTSIVICKDTSTLSLARYSEALKKTRSDVNQTSKLYMQQNETISPLSTSSAYESGWQLYRGLPQIIVGRLTIRTSAELFCQTVEINGMTRCSCHRRCLRFLGTMKKRLKPMSSRMTVYLQSEYQIVVYNRQNSVFKQPMYYFQTFCSPVRCGLAPFTIHSLLVAYKQGLLSELFACLSQQLDELPAKLL